MKHKPNCGKRSIRCRCTPENREFWNFISRTAREWRKQMPSWAREQQRALDARLTDLDKGKATGSALNASAGDLR